MPLEDPRGVARLIAASLARSQCPPNGNHPSGGRRAFSRILQESFGLDTFIAKVREVIDAPRQNAPTFPTGDDRAA